MISVRQWFTLLLVYIMYLLMGAVIFLRIESEHEMDTMKQFYKIRRKLSLTTYAIEDAETENEVLKSLEQLQDFLGNDIILPRHILKEQMDEIIKANHLLENGEADPLLEYNLKNWHSYQLYDNAFDKNLSYFWEGKEVPDKVLEGKNVWTLWNSFFFTFIALTTIGWGHMTPKTENGQIFFLFYAVVGVPLNGIVFATLADIFASQFIKRVDAARYESNSRIILDTATYLVPGLLIFFFLPAIAFMYAEDWSYINSFYFSFICLSTIGFGFYVPGHNNTWGGWTYPYRIFIFIWILFGLGYLLMIIAFIQKALRSKKLRALDRKISRFMKQSAATYAPEDIRQEVKKLATVLKKIDFLNQEETEVDDMIEQRGITEFSTENEVVGELSDETGHRHPPKVSVHRKHKNSVDVFLSIAEKVLQEDEVQIRVQGLKNCKSDGALSQQNGEPKAKHVGLDNLAFENVMGEEYRTFNSLPDNIFHRQTSSIWSDNEVLPQIPDENILELPDNLSIESKGSLRRRHFASQMFGHQDSHAKIGTLAELIDRVEEVLENEISKVEDIRNLGDIRLKPRTMSLHIINSDRHASTENQPPMKRQFSFCQKVSFY